MAEVALMRCSNCDALVPASECVACLFDSGDVGIYHDYEPNPNLPCGPCHKAVDTGGSTT